MNSMCGGIVSAIIILYSRIGAYASYARDVKTQKPRLVGTISGQFVR